MRETKIHNLIKLHQERRTEAFEEVNTLYGVLDIEDKLSDKEVCDLNLAISKLEVEMSLRLSFISELQNLLS